MADLIHLIFKNLRIEIFSVVGYSKRKYFYFNFISQVKHLNLNNVIEWQFGHLFLSRCFCCVLIINSVHWWGSIALFGHLSIVICSRKSWGKCYCILLSYILWNELPYRLTYSWTTRWYNMASLANISAYQRFGMLSRGFNKI